MKNWKLSLILGFSSLALSGLAMAEEGNSLIVCGLPLEESTAEDSALVQETNEKIANALSAHAGSKITGFTLVEGEVCAKIALQKQSSNRPSDPDFDWQKYIDDAEQMGRSLGGNH